MASPAPPRALRWPPQVEATTTLTHRGSSEASRLEAAQAIDMVLAWRVFHLTKHGRETPDLSCTVFFDEPEWQALAAHLRRNPIRPLQSPALREAILMLASPWQLPRTQGRRQSGAQMHLDRPAAAG